MPLHPRLRSLPGDGPARHRRHGRRRQRRHSCHDCVSPQSQTGEMMGDGKGVMLINKLQIFTDSQLICVRPGAL